MQNEHQLNVGSADYEAAVRALAREAHNETDTANAAGEYVADSVIELCAEDGGGYVIQAKFAATLIHLDEGAAHMYVRDVQEMVGLTREEEATAGVNANGEVVEAI